MMREKTEKKKVRKKVGISRNNDNKEWKRKGRVNIFLKNK